MSKPTLIVLQQKLHQQSPSTALEMGLARCMDTPLASLAEQFLNNLLLTPHIVVRLPGWLAKPE